MSDSNCNNKDFKPVVLEPNKQPAKPAEVAATKATPPAEALPEAKPAVDKVA